MKNRVDGNLSSNDSGEDSSQQNSKLAKLTTATTLQDKSNYSKSSQNELDDQQSLIDNPTRFTNNAEGFGQNGHEMSDQSTRSQMNSTSTFSRTYSPAPDVQNIIAQIKDPKDLSSAIDDYKIRSKEVDKEKLSKEENTKIKRYKDCLYFGQIINSKRHGKGIMVYITSRIYEGDWENDAKHGKGLEICPNGSQYLGHYLNGKPEGVGTFKWHNGEIYEGEWRNGMKHGSGMWRGTKGESYIGEWKYGKADGYGVHIWRNGDRYEGEFKGSLKHGHGTERFLNGDFYVGNYVNGKPDGYGEYYWTNACQYKGFFRNGLRYGKGLWKKGVGNADKYEGEWVNDKKCGYGVYTWVSGNIYKGSYFDDLRHGHGEMFWTDGSIYKGNWERGIQNGEGELSVPGKPSKKGLFQNNIFIGGASEEGESFLGSRLDTSTDNGRGRRLSPLPSSQKQRVKSSDVSFERGRNNNQDISFTHSEASRDQRLPKIKRPPGSLKPLGGRLASLAKRGARVLIPATDMLNEDKNIPPPPGGWLSSKEIAKWTVVRDKMGLDPKKFDNLRDEKIVAKIREYIHPKVWNYWAKNNTLKGRSDVLGQQATSAALVYYNIVN